MIILSTVYRYTRPLPKRSKVRGAAITEMLELKESKLNELKQSLAVERKEYYAKKSEVRYVFSLGPNAILLLAKFSFIKCNSVSTILRCLTDRYFETTQLYIID